jgi:hypothetical protein
LRTDQYVYQWLLIDRGDGAWRARRAANMNFGALVTAFMYRRIAQLWAIAGEMIKRTKIGVRHVTK